MIEIVPAIYYHNDPYSGLLAPITDMHIWKPIFHKMKLLLSVGYIHNTDVGGAVPSRYPNCPKFIKKA